jgi:hypothetical protein
MHIFSSGKRLNMLSHNQGDVLLGSHGHRVQASQARHLTRGEYFRHSQSQFNFILHHSAHLVLLFSHHSLSLH